MERRKKFVTLLQVDKSNRSRNVVACVHEPSHQPLMQGYVWGTVRVGGRHDLFLHPTPTWAIILPPVYLYEAGE